MPLSSNDRQAPIDISPDQFRAAGHELIDRIADVLAGMHERDVSAGLSGSDIRDLIDAAADMPDDGCEFGSLLSQTTELLTAHSLYNDHPDARSVRHGQDHFIVRQTNSKCNLRKPDHEY